MFKDPQQQIAFAMYFQQIVFALLSVAAFAAATPIVSASWTM